MTSSSNGRATAANAGNTGAPGESQLCGNCHNGGVFGTVNVSIQLFQQGTNIPVSSYLPGQTYDLSVSINNSSGNPFGYGFQLTALTVVGNNPIAGYFNLATNVKQKTVTVGSVAGRTYIEQNGVTNNNIFNTSWTAPAAGTGSIRFYAAGNAVNGNSSTSQDNGGSTTLTIAESIPLAVNYTTNESLCFGLNDAEINVAVSGGQPPYTFLWNDGSDEQNRSGLEPGTYEVLVTDAADNNETLEVVINQPEEIILDFTVTNAPFFGATGSAQVNISGGTPPLSISYSPTIEDFNSIEPGEYEVSVEDANGCTRTALIVIEQPSDYSVQSTVLDNICFEGSNGSIELEITGATPPYSILWNDGSTDEDRLDLLNGDYTVTVTDQNNYSYNQTFSITSPPPFQAAASATPIPCAGGESIVTFELSGGTTPYSTDASPLVVNTPGNYNYSFLDANQCEAETSVIVQSLDGISISSSTVTNPTCFQECNGSISIDVIGAVGDVDYNWSTGSTFSGTDDLCAGEYNVIITDEAGCSFFAEYALTEPAELSEESVEMEFIYDDSFYSVNINVLGGTPPYIFETSPNPETADPLTFLYYDSYDLTITDANGCVLTGIIFGVIPWSVNEFNSSTLIDLYPNPIQQGQVLRLSSETIIEDFTLVNQQGQLVLEDVINLQSAAIDTSVLSPGIYFLSIQTAGETVRKKVVVQ